MHRKGSVRASLRGSRERAHRVVANSQSIRPDALATRDVVPADGDIADPHAAERIVGVALDEVRRIVP